MENIIYNGIVADPRPVEEKENDYQVVELASSYSPVRWQEKKEPKDVQFEFDDKTWRKFPLRDQDGSSTCVAQTGAKLLGIDNYIEEGKFLELSASFIYHWRVNKTWGDGQGMVGNDAFEILRSKGSTLEMLSPSHNLSEKQVNSYSPLDSDLQTALVFKAGGYTEIPRGNIDHIASIIETQKRGVMVWFRFEYAEWDDVPHLNANSKLNCHHSVTAVDFTMWKGEKALVIDESWGEIKGFEGQRVITESFLRARNTYAGYTVDLSNKWRDGQEAPGPRPRHVFLSDLAFSPIYNEQAEVKALQEILRFEGLFPTHLNGQPLDCTGYYGAITASAVLDFQRKHKVASEAELAGLAGRKVGPKTREALNSLYA